MAGRRAIVTGASSGIGAAVVRALAGAGFEVHALARRRERLEALSAETGCRICVVDMRDTAALEELAALEADVVVNNAGLGAGITGLATASREDVAATIGTNVEALLQLTRIVLPGMIERGRGHIVNLGSVAGLYPINSAIYGGSKGAVHLISQNLRLELKGTGVKVTEICPARVDTEFFSVAVKSATASVPTAPAITALSAEDIADAILWSLQQPEHVNVQMIELQPTEQWIGGASFDPIAGATS